MNIDYAPLKHFVSEMRYPLVFVSISGAHLYGFPSPDSDYDLRGVHVLPLREVTGLNKPAETLEFNEVRHNIEFDVTTYDIRKYCEMALNRNGNVLDQVFSPLTVVTSLYHERLKEIMRGCITRHHGNHFRGLARTQWDLFTRERVPRVKPLLYVYRAFLSGLHLMRSGEMESNLMVLNASFKLPFIPDLLRLKLEKEEQATLSPKEIEFHHEQVDKMHRALEDAEKRTRLPEQAAAREKLNEFLLDLRTNVYPTL